MPNSAGGTDRRRPRVGYDDRGRGPAVALLSPFPFDRHIWEGIDRKLIAAGHRVLTIDGRGFGDSALVGDGTERGARYAIEDLADDVAALLDERDIRAVTLLGMSMGGYVALAFARRHPDRLERLILADTRAAADSEAARASRDGAIAQIAQDGVDAYLAASLPRLLSPGAPAAAVTALSQRAETHPASLIAGLYALRDRPDRSGELAAIRCPTLVVCGAREQVVPSAEMKSMADAIPGARFALVPNAGHLAHIEAPDAFAGVVLEFLGATTHGAP